MRIENELKELSTFDLAFNLARGIYDEASKFIALQIIKERELEGEEVKPVKTQKQEKVKLPLKGSKSFEIYTLLEKGKEPPEVKEALEKMKFTVYYPEIYRIRKKYFPERG